MKSLKTITIERSQRIWIEFTRLGISLHVKLNLDEYALVDSLKGHPNQHSFILLLDMSFNSQTGLAQTFLKEEKSGLD